VPDRRLALTAAAMAFAAGQGFGRFGLALILPSMRDGLGLSDGEMGLLAGISLAAYILFSVPAGALAARFGTRPVVVGGLVGTAVGLGATGLAGGLPGAVAAQVLVGVAGPAVIVPVLAIGGAWSGPEARGRATGLVVCGGGAGLLLAGLIVPLVLGPPGDPSAWRRAWWGLAVGTLAAAGVAAAWLRDPPGGAGSADRPRLGAVYRSSAVWRLALVFGLYGVSYIVYGVFFAAQLDRRGLDAAAAGRLWSLVGAISIGSGLLGGVLADRLGPARALVLMFATQGAGLATLALGDGVGWFALSAILYGASIWGFPSAVSKASTELVGPALAPAALGLLVLVFGVGQAFSPIAAGLLADQTGSLAPALLLGVAADALGALGSLLLPRARRIPHPA
jgi:MFS family permease